MTGTASAVTTVEEFDVNCERRVDRRKNTAKAAFYSLFMNRRVNNSRRSEHHEGYVDVHESSLFYMAFGAILLCSADAFFTLTLINFHGSRELNPVMDYLLQKDVTLFFYVKFIFTSIAVMFLVMHKNFLLFNRITGRHLLITAFCMYATLVAYELYMLVWLPFIHNLSM